MATPYSVYAHGRPLRTVFLVDPNESDHRKLDAIVDHCLYVWAGRVNPIVLTDGASIEDGWMQFLKAYDPDQIITLVTLSESLLKQLSTVLTPFQISQPRILEGSGDRLFLEMNGDSGLTMLPAPELVGGFVTHPAKLVVFKRELENDDISRFLARNFGLYNNIMSTDNALRRIEHKKEFEITDTASLNNALRELSSYKPFTYPFQYLSMWAPLPGTEYDDNNECLAVAVGDTVADFAYAWNRQIAVDSHHRRDINQLWLSRAIATNPELKSGFNDWLGRYSDRGGSSGSRKVRFVSYSLPLEELEQIAHDLTHPSFAYARCEVLMAPLVPRFSYIADFIRYDTYPTIEEPQLFRLSGEKEIFNVSAPKALNTSHGNWMVDFRVEYHPSNFVSDGRELYWKLPRDNAIAEKLFPENKTRICGNGYPACCVNPSPQAKKIELAIPDEYSIFEALICQEPRYKSYRDPRDELSSDKFQYVDVSGQGESLRGLLGLFENHLRFCDEIFSQPYWVEIFHDLCRLSDKGVKKSEEIVRNIVKKAGSPIDSNDSIAWIAHRLHAYFKSIDSSSTEVPFSHMEELMIKHTTPDTDDNKGTPINVLRVTMQWLKELFAKSKILDADRRDEYVHRMFREQLDHLVASNIILAGFKPKCPKCGKKNWYSLNEIEQRMKCHGCGHSFDLKAEQEWSYKLNSLVERAVRSDGITTLVNAIAGLAGDARSSFFYCPCLRIFEKEEGAKKAREIGDLDILCILDGNFVIGEAKTSWDAFNETELRKMVPIAKRLRPAVVLYVAKGKPNAKQKTIIASIKTELQPFGIEIRSEDANGTFHLLTAAMRSYR